MFFKSQAMPSQPMSTDYQPVDCHLLNKTKTRRIGSWFVGSRSLLWLLSVVLLTGAGCSTSSKRWYSTSKPDLSKIYVVPFSQYENEGFPVPQAAGKLTEKVIGQLSRENRLQVEIGSDSLLLFGAILSYRDEMLDVQGELYDGDEYLAFSRVRRHVGQNDDLSRSLELIAEQMLDELMNKMREHQDYREYYSVAANVTSPGESSIDSYYSHWGWWRHRPDKTGSSEPERHWDADGRFETLPRSGRLLGDMERKRAALENSDDPEGKKTSAWMTALGVVGLILLFVLAAALGGGKSDHDSDGGHCHQHHGSTHC